MGPVKSHLNEMGIQADLFPMAPARLASIVALIDEGKLSFAVGSQKLFSAMLDKPGRSALELAEEMNLIQDSNLDSLSPIIDAVIKEFPLKVEEYQKGKKGIISMFMGEVMKRSKGKADPKVATALLEKKLNAL
jgi:aspartyl-tRNA(Asn)/glutamyl-tRNA(Gln) amidotransferase subunit B